MEEKIISIGEKDYILFPSFRNIKRLQTRLGGERFIATGRRLVAQNYGPEDICIILFCLIDENEKVKYDKFAEDVFRDGFNKFYPLVVNIFADVMSVGTSDEVADENPPNR